MSTERIETVTPQLADYVVRSRVEDIPTEIIHEAKRALVNYLGCALSGARHPSMGITIDALGAFAGPQTAAVLGRKERFDPLFASLLNGISSHVDDFDDTTPSNYIHPTSPVASALFAYASTTPVSGRDFLHAYILGFECVTRIGNATYPAHYQAGWHSTGSIGVFGAAAAIGRLIGLDQRQMAWAIGLAATQAAGIRDMFGSMAKSFHPGRSAQSGYMAALLAQSGFTAGPTPLEGPRGFAAVTAGDYDLSVITDGLGERFLLPTNTYKPFPCGIVVHPTIDACLQLVAEHKLEPATVESVVLHVAPLVLDLCKQRNISTGLEGKFSIYHAAAIALVRQRAGLEEFSDATVRDPAVAAMRDKVQPVADASINEDGVRVVITLASGQRLEKQIEQSIGNIKRPLSDGQLEDKFRGLAEVIAPPRAQQLLDLCWTFETIADTRDLIARALP